MKHTKEVAQQVMDNFRDIGIRTQLIGSVRDKGFSENDVDLVLLDYPTIDNKLISKIQTEFPTIKYTITNWGGIFIEVPYHGNIDLFPNSYMEKCFSCKKKCCI